VSGPTDKDIEALAERLWNEREKQFPAFTRMAWKDGSFIARNLMLAQARRLLKHGPSWDMPLFAVRSNEPEVTS
jgi:hypothetical protein